MNDVFKVLVIVELTARFCGAVVSVVGIVFGLIYLHMPLILISTALFIGTWGITGIDYLVYVRNKKRN